MIRTVQRPVPPTSRRRRLKLEAGHGPGCRHYCRRAFPIQSNPFLPAYMLKKTRGAQEQRKGHQRLSLIVLKKMARCYWCIKPLNNFGWLDCSPAEGTIRRINLSTAAVHQQPARNEKPTGSVFRNMEQQGSCDGRMSFPRYILSNGAPCFLLCCFRQHIQHVIVRFSR